MSVKLYYYNAMGRAEGIRGILHYKGIQFEDIRLSDEEVQKFKDDGKLEFNTLPLLEMDGKSTVCT